MKANLAIVALTMFSSSASDGSPSVDQVLAAIQRVETGQEPRRGEYAKGDRGLARGPFQIHESYWRDSGLPGRYADCDRLDYSRRVVLAYWKRHCPEALRSRDVQVLARVHNGGPAGGRIAATLPYWRRVERVLKNG